MVINNMMTSISPRQYVNIEQNYLLYIIFGDEIYLLVDLYDIQNNKERKGWYYKECNDPIEHGK